MLTKSEEERALDLIAWVLDCTTQEARTLCQKIQEIQASGSSSARDVADAILFLKDDQRKPENEEIARMASKMPCPGSGKKETVAQDPEVLRFEGELVHQDFLDWIDQHMSRGYVVNVQEGARNPVLHVAGCTYLRPNPQTNQKITVRPKLCSTDEKAIRREATNYSKKLEHCTHCDI